MAWYVKWQKPDGTVQETLHDEFDKAKQLYKEWREDGRDVWIEDHQHRRLNLEAPVIEHMRRQLEWSYKQRNEAAQALELYERGVMWFRVNNVDVTEQQKASLRRMIDEFTKIIERIEADGVDSR